jgi:Ca2+-binding RTX toxin-like protein
VSAFNPVMKSVVEPLEGRTMFAAVPTAVVLNGALEITGTRRSDVITVSVNVVDATKVDVVLNGAAAQQFNMVDVLAGVHVDARGGHDNVSVDLGAAVLVQLLGGNGRDVLASGAAADLLLGGNGKDSLSSGAGDDRCNGGNGADLINGGDNNDTIDGGRGRDLLTGGLGLDHFLGRDKAVELVDMSLDDTHTDLSLVNDILDGFIDIFDDLF